MLRRARRPRHAGRVLQVLCAREDGRPGRVQRGTQRRWAGTGTEATEMYDRGIAARLRGDLRSAASHLDAAVLAAQSPAFGEDQAAAVRCLLAAGDVYCLLGDASRARAHYEEALELHGRVGKGSSSSGLARCLFSLGALARREGRLTEAASRLKQALAEGTLSPLLHARATGFLAELSDVGDRGDTERGSGVHDAQGGAGGIVTGELGPQELQAQQQSSSSGPAQMENETRATQQQAGVRNEPTVCEMDATHGQGGLQPLFDPIIINLDPTENNGQFYSTDEYSGNTDPIPVRIGDAVEAEESVGV
eukprot:Hpha_TRINITY_DN308_c0_g1::TRINITY_DN308_c0_g1_i1::g.112718::m.112718